MGKVQVGMPVVPRGNCCAVASFAVAVGLLQMLYWEMYESRRFCFDRRPSSVLFFLFLKDVADGSLFSFAFFGFVCSMGMACMLSQFADDDCRFPCLRWIGRLFSVGFFFFLFADLLL